MIITEKDILSLYHNKTLSILTPAYILTLGTSITKLFNKSFKVAIGLATEESLILNNYQKGDLFILINKHFNEYYYNKLAEELNNVGVLRQITMYNDDLLLLVINNPLVKDKYELFLQGKYSKMYTEKELEQYFRPECKICQVGLSIIRKDMIAIKQYEEEVREVYGIKDFRVDDIKSLEEAALPPIAYKEIIGATSTKFVKDYINEYKTVS